MEHQRKQTKKQSLSLVDKQDRFQSLIPCNLQTCTKRQIKEYFENTYNLYELIFSALTDDCYFFKCPDRLRLPIIFYLAHTASVYVNKMLLGGLIEARVDSHFEKMFETGVDEMAWDDTENYRMGGCYQWPSVSEVMDYRQRVRKIILEFIDNSPLELPVTMEHPWWALFMGIDHERVHLETSSVLLRQLPVSALKRPPNWKYAPVSMDTPAGPNNLISVPGGKVTLGKPRDFPSYAWDIDYGQSVIDVPEFRGTKYLVTNGEFIKFVEDGGYGRRELWTEEGWEWVSYKQACHPTFWVCSKGCKSGCGGDLATYSHCTSSAQEKSTNDDSQTTYRYRAIYNVIDMPWDWPVDVNYHEAKAFCSWKGPEYRLPTEAEHHYMRGDPPPSNNTDCDPIHCQDYPANFNLKYGSSSAVNMYPPSSLGFYDVYGNVWEWLEDHLNGLPGFQTDYLYDDYSASYFDGKHTMIMGGSWVSTGSQASRFTRSWFRRHFFQHLGFRLIHSTNPTPVRLCTPEVFVLGAGVTETPIVTPGVVKEKCCMCSRNKQFEYESKEKLNTFLRLQYDNGIVNNTPLLQFIEKVIKGSNITIKHSKAINFGCATGLTTFLLTTSFQNVVGVDYSGRLIDTAMSIQNGTSVHYLGADGQRKEVKLPEDIDTKKATFKQLTWIPNELEGFELVVFDFLERLTEPKGWLCKLWECVVPRGLVVITAASERWDKMRIEGYIGKWFSFLDSTSTGGQMSSIWQRNL